MKTRESKKTPEKYKCPGYFKFLILCVKSFPPSKVDGGIGFISALIGFLVWKKPLWLPEELRGFLNDSSSWLPYIVLITPELIYRIAASPYRLFASYDKAVFRLETKNSKLIDALEPKLEIRCASNIDGCKVGFGHGGHGRIFRVAVKNIGVSDLKNCQTFLVSIETNKERLWSGDQVNLAFQPWEAPNSLCKTLANDVVYFVDVVGVEGGIGQWRFRPGTKNHEWRSHPLFENLFHEIKEDRIFTISFAASDSTTVTKRFCFHWTGDIESSEMYMLD